LDHEAALCLWATGVERGRAGANREQFIDQLKAR
jgi:hypothetical protein